MNQQIKACLAHVKKPARYIGGEHNAVFKPEARVQFALCFPDLYEIGMSHLGSKILYGVINEMEGVACQRVYAPAPDMEAEMRQRGVSLYALESGEEAGGFDILGFTLQYEMNYPTVLNMLDLAGLPLYSRDRQGLTPLVIAGGPCVFNCEPVADFFDLVLIGEGEEATPELIRLYEQCRDAGETKARFLEKAAGITGVYVPSLYDIAYHGDGTIQSVTAENGAPAVVEKRIVADLDKAYFPHRMIVPSTDIVFDRAMVELFRGCRRGCRFCQAGHTGRPIRARSVDTLYNQTKALVENTGWDEVSLTSLSSSDYPGLGELCDRLVAEFEPRHVNLALPSLRADNFDIGLMESVQKVRKSGLTFAPEAGSQRLRDIINKNLREEDLLEACRVAFESGYNSVKLYYMLGLPGETDEDLLGISKMVRNVISTFRQYARNKARGIRINVGVSTFVPKAHTPFQWVGQVTGEEVLRRQRLLMDSLKIKNVTYSLHTYEVSFVEAVLARGDRRLSAAIEAAWRMGAVLDGWDEHFDFSRWTRAFVQAGIDPAFYANREIAPDEVLPWEHTSSGVDKDYLRREYECSLVGAASPDCKAGCRDCGANRKWGGACHV